MVVNRRVDGCTNSSINCSLNYRKNKSINGQGLSIVVSGYEDLAKP